MPPDGGCTTNPKALWIMGNLATKDRSTCYRPKCYVVAPYHLKYFFPFRRPSCRRGKTPIITQNHCVASARKPVDVLSVGLVAQTGRGLSVMLSHRCFHFHPGPHHLHPVILHHRLQGFCSWYFLGGARVLLPAPFHLSVGSGHTKTVHVTFCVCVMNVAPFVDT